MAHESFENLDIARLMNERFINVKVDRQERPDVDDIYQKVVQTMGQGGRLASDGVHDSAGRTLLRGNVLPAQDRYGWRGFVRLLLGLSEAWKNNRIPRAAWPTDRLARSTRVNGQGAGRLLGPRVTSFDGRCLDLGLGSRVYLG